MTNNTRQKRLIIAVGAAVLIGLTLLVFSITAQQERASLSGLQDHPDTISQMAPHKALYEIKMVSKSSGSQIINIHGQMYYEWKASCEAWISNHRFNLIYEYADSPAMHITSDFAAYETFNGNGLDFNSRRKRNGALYQELRGHAKIADLNNKTETSRADYTIPANFSFDLGEGTIFPMHHTVEVLKHIKNGKKFYTATVFDGSDKDGPVEINTFIGPPANVPDHLKNTKAIDASLIESPARKSRMAFFPVFEPRSESDYEMDITIHENGVISDMLVQYKDFSVSQKLIALERLENDTECGPKPEK